MSNANFKSIKSINLFSSAADFTFLFSRLFLNEDIRFTKSVALTVVVLLHLLLCIFVCMLVLLSVLASSDFNEVWAWPEPPLEPIRIIIKITQALNVVLASQH